MSSSPADLLPQARIRLAALELFGTQGFVKTTIRQIAARAGVSPGLVIHHFGSKNQLRAHCDDWVMDLIEQEKTLLTIGPQPALRDYLAEHPEYEPVMAYLVTGLREGGKIADRIYTRTVAMTEGMLDLAEANGLVRIPEDREAATAFLVASSLGFLMLSDQFARQLGGQHLNDPDVVARYGLVAAEVFAHGLFTPAYLEALKAANTTTPGDGNERPRNPDH